jgi:hypothetical protein
MKEFSHESPEYIAYIESDNWRKKRIEAINWHGSACKACGRTPIKIDIHHLSYAHFTDEPVEDLMPLCRVCHDKVHIKHKIDNPLNKSIKMITLEFVAYNNFTIDVEGYKVIQLPKVEPNTNKRKTKPRNRNPNNFTFAEINSYTEDFFKVSKSAAKLNSSILSCYSVLEGCSNFILPDTYRINKMIYEIWVCSPRKPLGLTPFAQKEILNRRNDTYQENNILKVPEIKRLNKEKYANRSAQATNKIKVSKVQVLNYFSSLTYDDENLKLIVLAIANKFKEESQYSSLILIKDVPINRHTMNLTLRGNRLNKHWLGITGKINRVKTDKQRTFRLSPSVVKLILAKDLNIFS